MDRPFKQEVDGLRKQDLKDAEYEASRRDTPPAPMRPASALGATAQSAAAEYEAPMRPASAPGATSQSAAAAYEALMRNTPPAPRATAQSAAAAYEASMRNTPPAPRATAQSAAAAAITEMLREARDAKARKKISAMGYAKGGSVSASKRAVKKYASGGSVSASSRGDGCATKGKTRGKML